MNTDINPFVIHGYEGPAYFCDREKETQRIISAVHNNRNIALISMRRIGKSGLIEHAFSQLQKRNDTVCFYLDLFPTNSLKEFIQLFSNATIGKLDTTPEKILKKITGFITGLRPVIDYDENTGKPEMTFELSHPKSSEKTLEQIFSYLSRSKKQVVIAIDEFQEIHQYPEKKVEALIRSFVQRFPGIRFIFSGSKKHVMVAMFGHAAHPFYQSAEMLFLEKIDDAAYHNFIANHFKKARMKISSESIQWILQFTKRHTWFTQYLLNRLFTINGNNLHHSLVIKVADDVLDEFESSYHAYRNMLSDFQWKLLIAIAADEIVVKPTSKDFIGRRNLGATSSVKSALHALMEKELVAEDRGEYQVYDVFLSRWLAKKHSVLHPSE